MKIKLLLAALFVSAACCGQVLHSEKGVSVSFDGAKKIGTRYEEKCNATFDVYRVTGTVENSNSDKAVRLLAASLTFNGDYCGWYEGKYRVESQVYRLSLSGSQTWQGQFVDVLPNGKLTLSTEILVAKDKDCPQPGYNLSFDLVTAQVQPTPQPQQSAPVKAAPQWSGWKPVAGTDCNMNIEYRFLIDRGFALNYQVHMYFEVRNNNDKTVSYTFNLADNAGKVHFGDRHTTHPGQTTSFVHKMSGDFIKKMQTKDVVYTTTGKPVCANEEVPQSTVQSVPQTDNQVAAQVSGEGRTSIMELIHKKNDLCEEFGKLLREAGLTSPVYDQYCGSGANLQYSINDHQRLKTEIAGMERAMAMTGKQNEAKQKEEDEKKRIAEAEQKKFDGLMAQGDGALDNRNYDSAMGYYTQAQNIASNDTQKSAARQKYNQAFEAKRDAAREVRVADAKKRDNTEDAAYTAAAGAALGAMSLLKDGYTHRAFSGKLQVGVGYDQTPMITNQTNNYTAPGSYTDKVAYPTIDFGLRFEILNNKPVNINLRGLYSVGLHAFETGVSGSHVVTGADGGIQFWYKTATKFKLFADFGWYQKTGERTRDQDAVNDGETATDDVREGTYKFQVMRLGFGPMLHFRNGGRETWIKPGVYFDKISFAKGDKPAMSFSLNTNVASGIMIEASYGKNYPAGGTATYPDALTSVHQDYYSISIIRQGKLW